MADMPIPKTGAVGTFLDFANDNPVAGVNLGVEAAIQPATDGESIRSTAATDILRRPQDNLRRRTESLRGAMDDTMWLRDADRATALVSDGGTLSWIINAGNGVLSLTGGKSLFLTPFLTAGNAGNLGKVGRSEGTLKLLRASDSTASILMTLTGSGTGVPSYNGGDRSSVTVVLGGALVFAQTSTYGWTLTVLNTSQRGDIITAINTAGSPWTASIAGGDTTDVILNPQASQYATGNWDSTVNKITDAVLATFMLDTPLLDGDSLCIQYDALIAGSNGGRRQSTPYNNDAGAGVCTLTAGSLFNSRVNPERLPNSIPVAKRFGTQLFLVNGLVLENGGVEAIGKTQHLRGYVSPNMKLESTGVSTIGLAPCEVCIDGALYNTNVLSVDVTAQNVFETSALPVVSHWYYLYAVLTLGIVAIEISATAPDASRTVKSTDATKTYLGTFRTTSNAGTRMVQAFQRLGRTTTYILDETSGSTGDAVCAADMVNTISSGAAPTALVMTTSFPPHVHAANVRVGIAGTTGYVGYVGGTLNGLTTKTVMQVPTATHELRLSRVLLGLTTPTVSWFDAGDAGNTTMQVLPESYTD